MILILACVLLLPFINGVFLREKTFDNGGSIINMDITDVVDFANQLQTVGEQRLNSTFLPDPVEELASKPSYGKPYLLGAIGSQEGGEVRDDMALLDMILHRR